MSETAKDTVKRLQEWDGTNHECDYKTMRESAEDIIELRLAVDERDKEIERLRKIVKLAELLIQPSDDGPQLVGHKQFRKTLMLSVRGYGKDFDLDDAKCKEIERLKAEMQDLHETWQQTVEAGGYDVSVCSECSTPVVCIPDGHPLCENCAMQMQSDS